MKLFLIFLFFTLAGCDSPEDTGTEVEVEDIDTVFDPMVDSLARAREVEDIVLRRKLEMDAALEKLEGEGDDTPE